MARSEDRGPGSGFTLVELLVVMMVLGILATIAISAFFYNNEEGLGCSSRQPTCATRPRPSTPFSRPRSSSQLPSRPLRRRVRTFLGVNYFGGVLHDEDLGRGSPRLCLTSHSAVRSYFGLLSGSGCHADLPTPSR